jgi:hypothetical protein
MKKRAHGHLGAGAATRAGRVVEWAFDFRSSAPALRRRGASIVYITVAMLVMFGFCSLAVDLGRVQAVKTELEIATDAAARAGAANLPIVSGYVSSDVALLQNAAINMAAQNNADGAPVTITSSNISLYNWPATTPLLYSTRVNATAVNVQSSLAVPLLFAQILGIPTCTVHASSTAYLQATNSFQLVGISSVQITGNPYTDLVDSYNSSLGPYGPGNMGSQGTLAGDSVSVNGGSTVNGNIYFYGSTAPNTSGATVNGNIIAVPTQFSYPTPTVPAGCTNLGAVTLSTGQTLTLNSGNYTASSFTFISQGTLNINATTGPVCLYMTGAFIMDYNAPGGHLNFTSIIPDNFQVYGTTSAQINFNGAGIQYVVVDAPLSTVQLYGGALYGAVICNNLFTAYGGAFHYDQALGTNGVIQNISQVQ